MKSQQSGLGQAKARDLPSQETHSQVLGLELKEPGLEIGIRIWDVHAQTSI